MVALQEIAGAGKEEMERVVRIEEKRRVGLRKEKGMPGWKKEPRTVVQREKMGMDLWEEKEKAGMAETG